MLLVKTKTGKSKIDGIGLFAAESIAKGTIIWQFHPHFDLEISRQSVDELSPVVRDHIVPFLYVRHGAYILCADDARYFNHSLHPNTSDDRQKDITIAATDIREGEEITCNYSDFDESYRGEFDSPGSRKKTGDS